MKTRTAAFSIVLGLGLGLFGRAVAADGGKR
jgi:hypothetical protein